MIKETFIVDEIIEKSLEELEENDKVQNIDKVVAKDAMKSISSNTNRVLIKGQTHEVYIVCQANESYEILPNEYNYPENRSYIINKNKAWFIPKNKNLDVDIVPDLRSLPMKSDEPYKTEYYFNKNIFLKGEESLPHKTESRSDFSQEKNTNRNITKLTQVSSTVPSEWFGLTEKNKLIYIRYRSGRLKLYESDSKENLYDKDNIILKAFIGEGFPGMKLTDTEILDIINSFNYINIKQECEKMPQKRIPEL